jgi:hypothetical protein
LGKIILLIVILLFSIAVYTLFLQLTNIHQQQQGKPLLFAYIFSIFGVAESSLSARTLMKY